MLLLAGAIVDARNAAQETPLIVAAREGHAEAVRALMEAGAEQAATDSVRPRLDVHAKACVQTCCAVLVESSLRFFWLAVAVFMCHV